MKKLLMTLVIAALASSCSKQIPSANRQSATARASPTPAPPAPPAQEKTRPVVDPKSTRAASDLVQGFVNLLNRREFKQAYMLLGPGAAPRSQFDSRFSDLSNLQVSAGPAGEQEGAAGSIYLSIPLAVSGTLAGEKVNRSATAIVRRVNDVPGSTEAQRRWHIERIDWDEAR